MKPTPINPELARKIDIANYFGLNELPVPIIHGGVLSVETTLEHAKKLDPSKTYLVRNPYITCDIQMTGAKIVERAKQHNLLTTGMVIAKGKENKVWYIVLKEHFENLLEQRDYIRYD